MIYNTPFSEGMMLYKKSETDKWNSLIELYKNNYLNGEYSEKLRIPKIIHQIWLGSPFPQEYEKISETWKKFHPDWEYHLWTDDNINSLELKNQEAFNKTSNLGAKSDILRCEILYQLGGLYIDTDFECLKAFDDIHYRCDFYAGVLPSFEPCIMNSLMGSAPNNAIIREIINRISSTSNNGNPDEVFNATGPWHLTRCFFDVVKATAQKCIIFPSTFFYPSPNYNSGVNEDIQKEYIKEESHAIHYWHISWTKNKKSLIYIIKKIIKHILPYGLVKSLYKLK